jgi:hypothetical protein
VDTSDDEDVSLDSEEEARYLGEPASSDAGLAEPVSPSTTAAVPPVVDGTTKQGYLEVKDAKKGIVLGRSPWRVRWVMIVRGSVHLFQNYEKTDAYLSINMKDAEIIEPSGEQGKDCVFGIKLSGTNANNNNSAHLEPKWFAASSQYDMAGWREALTGAMSREPSAPPVRPPVPRSQRTNNPLFRAKKRAATVVGVPVMKKLFGENIRLLETIKQIVTKHTSKETAKRVYNLLMKLIIKVNFQFEKKNLTLESLVDVDRPLREALELLTKYYNTRIRRYNRRYTDTECFVKVEQLVSRARDAMCVKLQPYLTPKNIENLRFLSDTLSNAKFLESVYTDPDLPEELDEIDDMITAYTQFHF